MKWREKVVFPAVDRAPRGGVDRRKAHTAETPRAYQQRVALPPPIGDLR
jgi:hypothetical protein